MLKAPCYIHNINEMFFLQESIHDIENDQHFKNVFTKTLTRDNKDVSQIRSNIKVKL